MSETVELKVDLWTDTGPPGDWLHWRLCEEAKAAGKTLNEYVAGCIEDGLKLLDQTRIGFRQPAPTKEKS